VFVEVEVESLGLDPRSNAPVVLLRERDGAERVLPIWIGPGEASAIAMHLAELSFSRPLTHDLMASVVRALHGRLERVVISRVKDSTYFAELVLHQDDETVAMDARPSDAIALALRLRAPILVSEAILERVALEMEEAEADAEAEGDAEAETDEGDAAVEADADDAGSDSPGSAGPGEPSPMTADELKAYLRRMNPEDFGRFTP